MEGMSISETFANLVVRAINRSGKFRDAVYLDTNAWSKLAKKEIDFEPLRRWIAENGRFLWMARFQVAELSAKKSLARPMADLLSHLSVVMLDYGQNEFSGKPWYQVKVEMDQYLKINSPELFDSFVREFMEGSIRDANRQVSLDGEAFRCQLEAILAEIPSGTSFSWQEFPRRLESWIRWQCQRNGVTVQERALIDRNCYIGLRLSFAVLYARYFLNRQRWKPSDYKDYLHASDMAYAGVVVTERNLAECIRQAAKRPEVLAPEVVVELDWLNDPGKERPIRPLKQMPDGAA
jgi:hypothetical protein